VTDLDRESLYYRGMYRGEVLVRGQLFLYQHSGLWLVKRVVHLIGDSFQTRLLLTRCGIDTDILTSLIEAENRIVK